MPLIGAGCKLQQREAAQAAVQPACVVVDPPGLDDPAGILQAEQMLVEARIRVLALLGRRRERARWGWAIGPAACECPSRTPPRSARGCAAERALACRWCGVDRRADGLRRHHHRRRHVWPGAADDNCLLSRQWSQPKRSSHACDHMRIWGEPVVGLLSGTRPAAEHRFTRTMLARLIGSFGRVRLKPDDRRGSEGKCGTVSANLSSQPQN
jgi:hypothetical protein